MSSGVAVICGGAAGWLAFGGRDDIRRRARVLLAGDLNGVAGEAGGVRGAAAGERGWGLGSGDAVRRWLAGRVVDEAGSARRLRLVRRVAVGREAWCLPAGLCLAVIGRSALPVAASVVAAFLVHRWLTARDAERARDRRAAEVISLCATVAGELRAGRQPGQALLIARAPSLGAAISAVLAAARYGGDVAQALRDAARLPGAEGLTGVAACWRVAVEGGAGLAAGLERIADGLRSQRDQREELRAQLAGPRATALMLALLPVCGLLMGTALDADPLRVLLHTPVGWGCLVIGGLLEWGGVAWTGRIVADAMPPIPRGVGARIDTGAGCDRTRGEGTVGWRS
ncbi:type II secretion system F family protein [Streptomyces sp. Pv4-95]